jgi:hypothetical protein
MSTLIFYLWVTLNSLQQVPAGLHARAVAECRCPRLDLVRILELPMQHKRSVAALSVAEAADNEYYAADGSADGMTLLRFAASDADVKGEPVEYPGVDLSRVLPMLRATRAGSLYAISSSRQLQRLDIITRQVKAVALHHPPWDYVPGSQFVVANFATGDPQTAGWPLHILNWSGERIRSFGDEEAAYSAHNPSALIRRLAGSVERGVFAASLDGMLREYDPAGQLKSKWILPRPPDARPNYVMIDLEQDTATGYLLAAFVAPLRSDRLIGAGKMNAHGTVAVVDPQTRTLRDTYSFHAPLVGITRGGKVFTLHSQGESVFIVVWRPGAHQQKWR